MSDREMTEKERLENLPPKAKLILNVGTLIGLAIGCAMIFVGPSFGIVGGALYAMVGATLGFAIAKPFALAAAKRP